MKQLLALSFILVAAGVPSVATYYPQQTYAVISVIEPAGAQVAAAFESQKEIPAAPAPPAPSDPYEHDVTGGDWETPVQEGQSAEPVVPELI